MRLIIEDVRSFVRRHVIPIKALTLVTGENSSGKTTLLASFAAVNDSVGFPFRPRFNEPPYSLGNYDTIATFKGGSYGRAESFSLGYVQPDRAVGGVTELVATYVGSEGLVQLSSLAIKSKASEYRVRFSQASGESQVVIEGEKDGRPFEPETISDDDEIPAALSGTGIESFYNLLMLASRRRSAKNSNIRQKVLLELAQLRLQLPYGRTLSIAPIRTKPRRTYDEITEEFSPEGEHVPFVLSNLLADSKSKAIIERFGKESGLYTKLDVRRLGKHLGDPSQVMVTGSNRSANLIDVGYGVSQVLPVIVQCLMTTRQNVLLLQQPEVHLHPRAQAALGSLFVDLVVDGNKQFIIETHSDYIIDRVRMEVGKGRIPAADVSILYLEKDRFETTPYEISLSESGDICHAPPSYRDFFLQEELNLLERAER
ncbi:MAG TPA: AAA family ATPase [Armatimonadota bacterium]|nr:AAA family ATPase [Armatimonadota bacterium]